MALIDLTNKRFGRLVVKEYAGNNKHNASLWICECDCGNITHPIAGDSLRRGNTRSCGCLAVEKATKHGKKNTRLYNVWQGMKARCYRSTHSWYNCYGGRGIKICDEWVHNFQAFYDWAMANGYRDDLTIDRIDNDGNYEPSNCRWTNQTNQIRNRTNSRKAVINGEEKSLYELAEQYGLKYQTIYRRYMRGCSGSDLIRNETKHMKERANDDA